MWRGNVHGPEGQGEKSTKSRTHPHRCMPLARAVRLRLTLWCAVKEPIWPSALRPACGDDAIEFVRFRRHECGASAARGKLKQRSSTDAPTALQRLLSAARRGRTHAVRHQAVVRLGGRRWPECRLYEVLRSYESTEAVHAWPATASLRLELTVPDPKRSHGGRDSAPKSRPLLIGRRTGDGRLGVPWRRVLFANVV
jgi:hypothetical protein